MSANKSGYRNALQALSARTGTPLSSLVVSFGILHEITAIAPLVGVFYTARTFGFGERVVKSVIAEDDGTGSDSTYADWARRKCRQWVEEGEGWAGRVGRRYGIFGFEKGSQGSTGHIAGDVANAVVAYGVTKAMLPVRIGLSLYLTPMFSRGIVEPVKKGFINLFRK
ncbi:hypothetical protein GYMLUDRAFT_156602 [Collybiopsis luxurians FD-317 M1]|nr:hypothetical protein GYMLUDRAFT_156602 [Collybiopsis luxurians FD-317 M1]